LGLLTAKQIKKQDPENPAFKRYFMHGVGHPLGLDVHDIGLTVQPMQAGWVMTVEPAIYLREEGFAVRLENNVLIAENGPVDLMAHVPIEASEIEALMTSGVKPFSSNGQRHHPVQTRRRTAPVGN
jgi:Xaa-Pro aminopeptidase